MKIYLCGQKAFGAAALAVCLRSGHQVVGVSAPLVRDREPSRPDRLRAAAEGAGIPVMPAGMLTADSLPGDVDLIVAAHSHDFIGRKTRMRSRFGAVGYHPSLLPLHRGRDAVRWTVKMGDRVAGGSIYWLDDNVDCGPVAAQDFCLVPEDCSAERLWREFLFPMGLRLLDLVLSDLAAGVVVAVPQDEELATWEPSWDRAPLRRPDLLLIGDGRAPGIRVVRERQRPVGLSGRKASGGF